MEALRIKLTGQTAVKYLLSYLIIISVLILGFFFVLKKQVTDSYFEYRSHEAQLQLKSVAEQFGEDLLYLSRIDSAIVSDIELIEGRYREASELLAIGELREYAATTQLISSIVYLPRKTGVPMSTLLPVSYREGRFLITDPAGRVTVFDPTPWLDARTGQLIYLADSTPYMIYFPAINSRANYIFFYILDTEALQKQFKSIMSEETLSVALTDSAGHAVMGVNTEALRPYLSAETLPNGVHQADESYSLCVQGGINRGFTLVSLLSRDFLSERINEAFASSYLALIGLSLVGFLLVILAMRITYLPLQRLTRKIVPDASSRQGYLNQLESAFSQAELQQRLLRKKLDNYRLSIQKSLLDTLVFAQYPGAADSLDMDALFDPAAESRLYILQIQTPEEALPWDELQQSLLADLPETGACILLEPKPAGAVFLLNYTGSTPSKDQRLRELLDRLCRERNCLCAVSNGSDSPLDIPVLYENAACAASFWPRTPVAVFPELPLGASAFAYPHESLNRLTSMLSENHFSEARCEISRLFGQIDLAESRKGNLTDFFVQCVLTDILTRLTNFMNLSCIRFADYSDLYFKTLHLCRGGAYGDKGREIRGSMEQLLDFCEQAIAEKIISAGPLIRIVEECYCQPEFSITALADRFHVSTAYMSQLFKKELNVNFSDYLWNLRQKKAQTLLRESELPIEEVSLAVGYVNTSSFRRKFKQETGLTPSQYREKQTAEG